MIFQAIEFAAAAHNGQYRKGTRVPYILHPLNVARTLIEAECEDPVVVAGVLHDVIEDTAVTYGEIREKFGTLVADLVASVSEPDKLASWEARKEHTLAILRTAGEDTLLVSVADKLDNIRSVREDLAIHGEKAWKRFKRGRDKQQWYYESLAEIFNARFEAEPGLRLAGLLSGEVKAVFGGNGAGR